MRDQPEPGPSEGPAKTGHGVAPLLARQLTGALPCLVCRYDLRGLSVRAVCPECGTPVRATILAKVDPYAGVLRPLDRPRLTAAGFVLWAAAALVATGLTWSLRIADAYAAFSGIPGARLEGVVLAATICIVLSGLGSLVLIRPHSGIARWQSWAAAAGAVATFAMAGLYWRLHGGFDMAHLPPYFTGDRAPPERTLLRLLVGSVLLVILVGLRPNARLLAARSLLLRMGRVDRQTMLAMVAALGIAAAGDALHLLASLEPGGEGLVRILAIGGEALIAVGSMLLTVGVLGMAVDNWRVAPVLLRPPLAMGEVVGPEPGVGAQS